MQILMIAPQPFYTERGTPINVRFLCEILGEAGHKVDLLVLPTGNDIKLKNIRIFRVPNLFLVRYIPIGPSWRKFVFDILLTFCSMILVSGKKYDVIHGVEEGGLLAAVLGKLAGIASIYDMDSCIPDQLKYSGFLINPLALKWVAILEKWSINHSALTITVCETLSERAKIVAPKATIIQIEDIPINYHEESMNENVLQLRKYYELDNVSCVVYTGNLQYYQGIDLLLNAWEILNDRINRGSIKIKLVVVGMPERVDHYEKIAAMKNLEATTCWVGPRPLNEISSWIEMSDVLVSPRSHGDNTPLKIYSYMASGRPIVATKVRSHTQVLDESMAFLVEPSPRSFANGVSEALTDNALSKRKAKKAEWEVEKQYSLEIYSKKVLDSYHRLFSRLRHQTD